MMPLIHLLKYFLTEIIASLFTDQFDVDFAIAAAQKRLQTQLRTENTLNWFTYQ